MSDVPPVVRRTPRGDGDRGDRRGDAPDGQRPDARRPRKLPPQPTGGGEQKTSWYEELLEQNPDADLGARGAGWTVPAPDRPAASSRPRRPDPARGEGAESRRNEGPRSADAPRREPGSDERGARNERERGGQRTPRPDAADRRSRRPGPATAADSPPVEPDAGPTAPDVISEAPPRNASSNTGLSPSRGTTAMERIDRRIAKLDKGERRFALIVDIEGPKVRMGLFWFLALVFASAVGRFSVALLFSVVCVVAALQVAAHLMIEEDRRSRLAAGVIAGLLTVSAVGGPKWTGAAALIAVGIAYGAASQTLDRDWMPQVTSLTLRAGFFIGLAGASAVLAHRVDAWAYFFLIFAMSAYEAGSFLVGSGARNQLQGPLAGSLAILAVTLGASAFEFPPLTETNTWIFGIIFAILCPLGQLAGTALLPRADAKAPALRRIDSYLLAGPVYVVGLWIASGNF